jgi:ABC-type transporter Mla subunit MlaD
VRKNWSDYIVALGVLACSAVLLGALTVALTGWRSHAHARTLEVDFPDITGIRLHAEVRYAGAPAGSVSAIRHLTTSERSAAEGENKRNAVRVSLVLRDDLPQLPADIKATLASDTLLSEKFVALSAGSPDAPRLADGSIIQGHAGAGIDDLINSVGPLLRSVDEALASVAPLVKKTGEAVDTLKAGISEVIPRVNTVADSARMAASSADELLKRADKLIAENEGAVKSNLIQLKATLSGVQASLTRVDGFVGNTDKQLASRMQELSVILQNLKVATTHAKSFTQAIGEKPSRVIFSGKPMQLRAEETILRSNQPLPAR